MFKKKARDTHAVATADIGQEVVLDGQRVVIETLLAAGGFGSVYIARDAKGKEYALKKVLIHDQETLDVTTREMEFMRQLPHHHNIVTLHASGVRPSGRHMEALLLMEYCPGGHVVDIMNRRLKRHFTEAEVLKIFSDICLAVAALHQQQPPIIHRDVKLENVLLSKDKGSFKLCDFGSATTKVWIPGDTAPVAAVEEEVQKYTTPNYRAPEMIDLYSKRPITEKADIWALGCMLYKLMFFEDAFADTPLAVLNRNYKIPEGHRFSPELIALLHDIFESDPAKRMNVVELSQRVFALRKLPCPLVTTTPAVTATSGTALQTNNTTTATNGSNSTPARSSGFATDPFANNNAEPATAAFASAATPSSVVRPGAAGENPFAPARAVSPDGPSKLAHSPKGHRRAKSNPFSTVLAEKEAAASASTTPSVVAGSSAAAHVHHQRTPSNPFTLAMSADSGSTAATPTVSATSSTPLAAAAVHSTSTLSLSAVNPFSSGGGSTTAPTTPARVPPSASHRPTPLRRVLEESMMNRSVSVDSPGLPVRGSNPFGDASDRRPRASAGAIETTPTIATVGAAAPSAASLFEDDESDTATLTSVPTTTTTTTPRNRKVSRAGSLNADIERRGTPSINNRVPPPVANTRSSLFDSAFDDDDERGILGAEDMV